MIVVNGPVRHELGFNTAGGAFGPGFRPNATVAGAIGLIVRNAFGIRPHVLEQATQGLPGRWSITATPQACADCLVPQDLMRSILGDTLGVPPDAIELTYPTEGR